MSEDSYARPSGVLQNNFKLDDAAKLQEVEGQLTASRINEIHLGKGPEGNFDRAHLQAIHHHIFQDVYPWAGRNRDETFTINGHKYEPIGISKGDTTFVPPKFIENGIQEALKPINDRTGLNDIDTFSEKAGAVMGELNYVHAAREGNGRTQRNFISELGRAYGHEVDFSAVTRARMIEASIDSTRDPTSNAMRDLVRDSVDPVRGEALRSAIDNMKELGEDPQTRIVRIANPGEQVTGEVFGRDKAYASVVTDKEVVVADSRDVPNIRGEDISFKATREISQNNRSIERTDTLGMDR